MKNSITTFLAHPLIGLFVVILLFSSCQETTHRSKSPIPPVSPALQYIIKDGPGVVRSIDFTMNREQVKELETGNLVHENIDKLVYDVDFNESEFADISYVFSEKDELISINIDIYLVELQTAKKTHEELIKYFNQRYHPSTNQRWAAKEVPAYAVDLQLLDEQKDIGLVIQWTRKGS